LVIGLAAYPGLRRRRPNALTRRRVLGAAILAPLKTALCATQEPDAVRRRVHCRAPFRPAHAQQSASATSPSRVGVVIRGCSEYASSVCLQDWWQRRRVTEIVGDEPTRLGSESESGSAYTWLEE
jgi:hypothetical protein